jgi:hypothetical protein
VKKHINLVAVVMFVLALASFLGKVKPGYGFSNGG